MKKCESCGHKSHEKRCKQRDRVGLFDGDLCGCWGNAPNALWLTLKNFDWAILIYVGMILWVLFNPTPAKGDVPMAEQLHAAVQCRANDAGDPFCEVRHYFSPWNPLWEVWLEDRLVATHEGRDFKPVLDERWRRIKIRLPWETLQLMARRDPETKKLAFYKPKE